MDLVDEENILGLQVRQDSRQIARSSDHRSGSQTQSGAHLAGDDVRERRFAQARRSRQENVVERLVAALGRGEEDREVLTGFGLSDVFGERLRAELRFDGEIVVERDAGEQILVVHHEWRSVYGRSRAREHHPPVSLFKASFK